MYTERRPEKSAYKGPIVKSREIHVVTEDKSQVLRLLQIDDGPISVIGEKHPEAYLTKRQTCWGHIGTLEAGDCIKIRPDEVNSHLDGKNVHQQRVQIAEETLAKKIGCISDFMKEPQSSYYRTVKGDRVELVFTQHVTPRRI